jgi:hypothetical protein
MIGKTEELFIGNTIWSIRFRELRDIIMRLAENTKKMKG